jgi:sugar lactone lactonase YvrE
MAGLLAVTACAPMQLAPMRSNGSFSDAASLEGLAMGPASLVANNSAGLIANNSAGLIANNSAGFRIASLDQEVPLPRAVIYLTDARDRFFEGSNGKPLSTTTDETGHYVVPREVPINQPVIVNVVLSENRREVGFTVPKAGKNVVNVSLASNYVTEFLRHSSVLDGKTMAAYPLDNLLDLTDRTNQALLSQSLATPSLRVADIASMNMTYAKVIGANTHGLGDAWAQMLGRRVMAVTTLAGTGAPGSSSNGTPALKAALDLPKGLASDKNGNLYVVEEGGNRVRRIAPDGTITTVAGNGGKGFSGEAAAATSATLNGPRAVAVDPSGNLVIADTLNMVIRVLPKTSGFHYGVSMTAGNLYTIAGVPDPSVGVGINKNDHTGDNGPAVQAKLAGPRGLAFDSLGNLYFSESYGWPAPGEDQTQSWHFIRKITPQGIISTIAGLPYDASTDTPSVGYSPDGTPAVSARLNYPNQLAIDAQDRLYIAEVGDDADLTTNRIRVIDLAELRSNPQASLRTLAGGGTVSGDGANATATQLNQPYGVAVGSNGVVYFAERGSEKVRAVLPDGTIRTLAGGGTFATDGDGPMLDLSQPHDLCVDTNGDLVFADARSHKVRKVSTRFGL